MSIESNDPSSEGAAGPSTERRQRQRERTSIARNHPVVRFAIDRKITMVMAILGLIVLGVLSLMRLPLEFLPSFESNSVSVFAPWPSSSPEEVERQIVRPLEDSLGTINGVETLTSNASAESGSVNLTFAENVDMDLAAVDVRDRIDRVRNQLPDDLERVWVRRFQSSDIPVLRSNLAAPWSEERLNQFVEEVVQPRLERLEGVAQAGVHGIRTRQLRIDLIPSRLAAHGVDVSDLASAIRLANQNTSAGVLRERGRVLLVRAIGELRTIDQIRNVPIRADGLKIEDVAEVSYDFPAKRSFSYLNGTESVSLSINKVSSANVLSVVNVVKRELADIAAMPEAEGLVVKHFHDASKDVTQGLTELSKAGFIGGGLAVVFMFLFLRRFRTTVLIAIAIPLSLIGTFVIIYLLRQLGVTDITLNVMSLMGLMLAVGMLFDNSIVVIESIFRHRSELGEDARTAALHGASAVAMPIIASTITTACVFVPMIFVSGGGRGFLRFMGDIGLTVVVVMVASLIISLTVVPMVAALILRAETRRHMPVLDRVISLYGGVIGFTLRHRLLFAAASIGLLWFSWNLYMGIGRSMQPPSLGREFTLSVDAPAQATSDEKMALYRGVYELLDENREAWEIADVAYRWNLGAARSRSRGHGGSNRFDIYLTPEAEAERSPEEISDEIREALPTMAGVTFRLAQSRRGPPGGGGGLNLELEGEDMAVLELLAPMVVEHLRALPMLKDIDTSLESGDQEIVLSVEPSRALQSGLSSRAVGQTVSSALSERNLSYIKTPEREVGVVMQYREEDRETLDQLRKLPVRVRTPGALESAAVPIGSLATFDVARGARSITRENRNARITISAESTTAIPSFVLQRMVSGTIAGIPMPEGYSLGFGRSWDDAEDDANSAIFAFIFATILIYMIMASLFESFAQPLTIMFSIPFAFIGVGLVMKAVGQPRDGAADMGLIILAGIVVNNAIVLIDHIGHLRREGLARDEAIVLGGKHRLRPILMTAITTILGLSPMVAPFVLPEIFGRPEGRAAYWAPMGLVILGGLTTSTFLTLLVIPTIYSLIDDATRFVRRVAALARRRPRATPGEALDATIS